MACYRVRFKLVGTLDLRKHVRYKNKRQQSLFEFFENIKIFCP